MEKASGVGSGALLCGSVNADPRGDMGQRLPIYSVQIVVRCTPKDLPESAEAGHSPSVPQAVIHRPDEESATGR
jgi:hypothetical protein